RDRGRSSPADRGSARRTRERALGRADRPARESGGGARLRGADARDDAGREHPARVRLARRRTARRSDALRRARRASELVLARASCAPGGMLKLFPARTLYDAVQDLDRLDDESLKGYLAQHSSKAWLLAAPQEPGAADAISAEAVQAIIRRLKHSYRYVVI